MKRISCANCKNTFDPENNRAFVFSKLPLEEQMWPMPALDNMLKELKSFNVVKCPQCGSVFKSNASRILNIFSPIGFLLFAIVFIILIGIFSYFLLLGKL